VDFGDEGSYYIFLCSYVTYSPFFRIKKTRKWSLG
jgi:hypothetical protein